MNKKILLLLSLFLTFFLWTKTEAAAASHDDQILEYDITCEMNEDATVSIDYHIEWKVLNSKSAGELTWIKVGIPNKNASNITALSDNIDSIRYYSDGGHYVRIDLDRGYVEGEVLDIDFSIVQSNMYQVNKFSEGETSIDFTPGWFHDIDVDNMTLRWKEDKVEYFSPECEMQDGYLVWSRPLPADAKFTITVNYLNDAYNFDLTRTEDPAKAEKLTPGEMIITVVGIFIVLIMVSSPLIIIAVVVIAFKKGSGFGTGKKITRTKIVYYPVCQGCGAARNGQMKNCEYCGRSFIKSEEVLKEDDKSVSKYKTDGTYMLGSDSNTYVRVHVVNVPRPTYSSAGRSSCAHSSCACACACACAGGGRAGCTTKDFYNTRLKLSSLLKRNKKSR